ncbi:MAG: hypothetical protein ACHRXM_33150 [Isosphaerales bacterium]
MALVEPYASCPCGSGQKYKWCCQKVEAYSDRAQRLLDSGQYEAALKPLEEGLAKVPENAWLLMRKAMVHLHLHQVEAARLPLRVLLQKNPSHLGASILLTRVELETDGPVAAVAQFQQAMSARQTEERKELASLASFLGSSLSQAGYTAAAIKHLELAVSMASADDKQDVASLQAIRTNPAISLWEKNPYRLGPAPEHVSEPFREAFERALAWAGEGLWSAAASAFELLATGSGAGVVAERNRGLCCLWLADHDGAVMALRRYITRAGPTSEAVDLEALCQSIEEPPPHDLVEFVQLTWPIRNRDGLLAALRADKTCEEGRIRPVDPSDPKSPEVVRFFILDRPRVAAKPGLTRQEIPLVDGQVLVDKDTVILEAHDDGGLDDLVERFTAAAGLNIPPAHPRTKVIGHEQRYLLALSHRWQVPDGVSEQDEDRLNLEQLAHLVGEIWPKTLHPSLRWRSPLEAARAGDAETALRAAVRQLEASHEVLGGLVDWDQFRSKLHLKPEPAIEPDRLDIAQLHLSRLSLIPVERLDDDDQVLALFHHSRQWGVRSVMNRVGRLIDQRPSLLIKGGIQPITLYGELALDAAQRNDRAQAESWLARGRQSDPPQKRSAHALAWEMIDLQLKMVLDLPEVWVPFLAALFERYSGSREATSALLLRLVNLGLVQAVADPNRPNQIVLDTRILEDYLTRYGPRITTVAGESGQAAARGEIWTPDAGAARTPIWTPGSASPSNPGGEKPKIILPGR